jgi:hypothetical protein
MIQEIDDEPQGFKNQHQNDSYQLFGHLVDDRLSGYPYSPECIGG